MTRKCFGDTEMARKVFWCGGSGKKIFGMAGVASGKKSVLAWRECQEKCFGIAGLTILPPLSSDKIRGKILEVQNLLAFYQWQSQLTGGQVLGSTLLPSAGVRVPLTTSTQG